MAFLYLLSVAVLLAVPVLQIQLHRHLSRSTSSLVPSLESRNHLLLALAVLAAGGVYSLVNPEANIRVDLLVAIPISLVVLLLWGMFTLRAARM